ncbi:hypothetical protein Fmac_028362 [Flemingia macrophylla]|uniref:Uncharacterized protein n=1 Tax=Flemingia macrophylla TaxID=520843 RepID=A0ABD1L795_9FABA
MFSHGQLGVQCQMKRRMSSSKDSRQEEFQSIYSQARSEAASCGGGSQSSPIDSVQGERIRKESWFIAAGGKNSKRKVYVVGKVSPGYRLGDRLPEPGHGIPDSAKILQLEEEVRQSREEARKSREEARQTREPNERLNKRFQSLVNVVLPLLSPDAQTLLLHQDDEQPNQETQDYADY